MLPTVCAHSPRPTRLSGASTEWRFGNPPSLRRFNPTFGALCADLPTFPSRFPLLALDRILGNPQSMISSIEVHNTALARVASDHLPIKARIDVGGAASIFVPMRDRMAA